MDTENDKKEEILFRAKKLLHLNNLLIEQCSRWLPEEEGYKNMEEQIRKRINKSNHERNESN